MSKLDESGGMEAAKDLSDEMSEKPLTGPHWDMAEANAKTQSRDIACAAMQCLSDLRDFVRKLAKEEKRTSRCARKGRIQMSFDEALNILSRDERFKATVYAMNTLLIRKGIYTAEEFERLFCQHAENYERGFVGGAKVGSVLV